MLKVALTATVVAASLGLLAGCSGSGSTVPQTLTQDIAARNQAQHRDPSGVATRYLSMLRFGAQVPAATYPNLSTAKRFAVSDVGSGAVEVLNAHYALHQTITSGLNGPDGDWYDIRGRLYVANYIGVNVTEYAPGGSTPIHTYSAGLLDPVVVTTDGAGRVFVGDYNSGGSGFVNEYQQGSNSVVHSCSRGGRGYRRRQDRHSVRRI
jgi:hypothetical protein